MKRFGFLLAAFSISFAVNALASSKLCASADGTISYTFRQSNGPAAVTSETLTQLNQTLISQLPNGTPQVRDASFRLVGRPRIIFRRRSDLYRTVYFAQTAVVQVLPNNPREQALFNDFVMCVEMTYIGPPVRP